MKTNGVTGGAVAAGTAVLVVVETGSGPGTALLLTLVVSDDDELSWAIHEPMTIPIFFLLIFPSSKGLGFLPTP
jgi:hypothetical protein